MSLVLAVGCGSSRRRGPAEDGGSAGTSATQAGSSSSDAGRPDGGSSAEPEVAGAGGAAGRPGSGSDGGTGTFSGGSSGAGGSAGAVSGGSGNVGGGSAGEGGGGTACRGCLVGDTCYPDGVQNPLNPCEICDTTCSRTAFCPAEGARCDDGVFCNGEDSCEAASCSRHRGDPCADGVACNGAERCVEDGARCAPSSAGECAEGEVCNVQTDSCALSCAGCVIGAACYPNGGVNPLNACEVCDVARSRTAFSGRDGAACDDGVFCNGVDSCVEGTCAAHTGDPCLDDIVCNGVERCVEAQARCAAGAGVCDAGEICDMTADACVPTCAGCLVSGVCYPDGATNPRNACEVCDSALSATAFSGNDGAACNDGVFCNGADRCVERRCLRHAGDPCDGSMTCSELGERCCPPGDGSCGCRRGQTGPTCERCLIHVDATNGFDENDGADWSSAKQSLDSALEAADTNDCDVWVAAGTYVPSLPTDEQKPRTVTFRLRPGVALYGGFAGTEARLEERRPAERRTILSGELGDTNDVNDNAYHVVTGATGAVLDGFVIRSGNAQALDVVYGGGMLNQDASPIVRNCRFEDNLATLGGGMANLGSAAPRIEDCVFRGNSAVSGGAIYAKAAGQTLVRRSAFLENGAGNDGAALAGGPWSVDSCVFLNNQSPNNIFYVERRSSATIRNCTFSGNTGHVVLNAESRISVIGSIFWSNSESQVYGAGFTPDVTYSVVQGGHPGAGNLDVDPSFVNGTALTKPEDLALRTDSPCIDQVWASDFDYRGAARYDDPRVPNPDNWIGDIGAFEYRP